MSRCGLTTLDDEVVGQYMVSNEIPFCANLFHLNGERWYDGSVQVFAQATRTKSAMKSK
ncbi:hypothetical protein KIN20_017054, partial [Parelaphostrongylus tenuis]